jgi:hypothetical protein
MPKTAISPSFQELRVEEPGRLYYPLTRLNRPIPSPQMQTMQPSAKRN